MNNQLKWLLYLIKDINKNIVGFYTLVYATYVYNQAYKFDIQYNIKNTNN